MEIKSAFKPPAICRKCANVAKCESIHWAYADERGLSCRAFPNDNELKKVSR